MGVVELHDMRCTLVVGYGVADILIPSRRAGGIFIKENYCRFLFNLLCDEIRLAHNWGYVKAVLYIRLS